MYDIGKGERLFIYVDTRVDIVLQPQNCSAINTKLKGSIVQLATNNSKTRENEQAVQLTTIDN